MKRWLMMMTMLTFVTGAALAQGWDGRWGVGLESGVWKQVGGDNDYSNMDQFTGLKLRYGLDSRWTVDMGLTYGWTRPGVGTPGEDAGFSFDTGAGLYTRIWQPSVTGTYRFVEDGTWRPWGSIGAGVNYFFGNPDKDGDGIPNDRDADPENPEDFDGYRDADGAPDVDNDNDGILDAQDGAPDDPEDFDGFQDEDGVPDPDNDNDGIIDAEDAAPDEAEDMDGFQDEDGVPDPDNDGDGVLDNMDRCPNTPAGVTVDVDGCPVVQEIREDLVLEGVSFKSGSAELTPGSIAVLDKVAESLGAWPEVRLEVQGHTDSSGSAELNRNLSQKRAETVRDYLVMKRIAPERVTAVGYGEDRPIADNGSREGRATNRRVELHRTDR